LVPFGSKIAPHAVVGCITSAASNGKCGSGAPSAAFSETAGQTNFMQGLVGSKDFGDKFEGGVISAVVGGTASVLGQFHHWFEKKSLVICASKWNPVQN
jgi:hypothetical protein